MRTVKSLIAELKKFPKNAHCYAYEGEDVGITIIADNGEGFISANCSTKKDKKTKVFKDE